MPSKMFFFQYISAENVKDLESFLRRRVKTFSPLQKETAHMFVSEQTPLSLSQLFTVSTAVVVSSSFSVISLKLNQTLGHRKAFLFCHCLAPRLRIYFKWKPLA